MRTEPLDGWEDDGDGLAILPGPDEPHGDGSGADVLVLDGEPGPEVPF